jgi:DNA gyrase subunit A
MTSNERIIDIDVSTEMRDSFLEYSYSVIYSRALPDARDGLKPVQRRIIYQMGEMGLRPERGHVKCARVTGEVMGKLHPHGDGAIYDALVRMSQDFTLRLPLIDGHGNFGSLDDGPAAARYTEARLAAAAVLMNESLDEAVIDFQPNYDAQLSEPSVLPAAFPNLLVNGASGIAVGMATNMPPHNLREVVAALSALIANPAISLDEVLRVMPGPDLPTGAQVVRDEGLREAYETGRGSFRMRAVASIESVGPRKMGIVFTALPHLVGPERVIEKIRDGVNAKRLTGISNVVDLTDRENGLRLVIELKSGIDPESVLQALYRYTPLEENFSVNNVALVQGRPQLLGLLDLLSVYLEHRVVVTKRRTTTRLERRLARLHLIDGLRTAVLNLDEVIEVIRSSDTASDASARLQQVFDLSDIQAEYILELRLRRLTRFSLLELDAEADQLNREIEELRAILSSEQQLLSVVDAELRQVAKEFGDPRRSAIVESSPTLTKTPVVAELTDDPASISVSPAGRIYRGAGGEGQLNLTLRSDIALVTVTGEAIRVHVADVPPGSPETGPALDELVGMQPGTIVAVLPWRFDRPIALGTALGVVKRVDGELPDRDRVQLIMLKDGDTVIGASSADDAATLCFVTNQANLLKFAARLVRPQGLSAAGMAGIKLDDAVAIAFAAVEEQTMVLTVANSSLSLAGTDPGSAKLTPVGVFPEKGRATQGVRCQKFLKNENQLYFAGFSSKPIALDSLEREIELPEPDQRRDSSGTKIANAVYSLG